MAAVLGGPGRVRSGHANTPPRRPDGRGQDGEEARSVEEHHRMGETRQHDRSDGDDSRSTRTGSNTQDSDLADRVRAAREGLDPLHVPVMLDRIVELLAPALTEPGAVLVDGTLGLGGHAEALLKACPEMHLVWVHRDTSALERSAARLEPYADRTTSSTRSTPRSPTRWKKRGSPTRRPSCSTWGCPPHSWTRPTAVSP